MNQTPCASVFSKSFQHVSTMAVAVAGILSGPRNFLESLRVESEQRVLGPEHFDTKTTKKIKNIRE